MTMNARTLSLITGLVASAALAPSALAVSGCTNSYLFGNYAIQFSGVATPGVAAGIGGVAVPPAMSAEFQTGAAAGGSAAAPIAGAVRLSLDGSGNITGYSSESMGGQWLQGNVTGTYLVNNDCTFSIALTDASANTENFGGVLVGSQARSGIILQTDAGSGVSGTLKSVRGSCLTSDLQGTFGLQYAGTAIGTPNNPYSSIGVVSLDGQGNLTASESRFSSGSTSLVQSIGTMTVNPDCSFTMALSSISGTGAAVNFFGIASSDNKQLLIVESDAGTAVSGAMTSQ
jgi:hypothetical protein